MNNEAVTPADSTSAAHCNVRDFGTPALARSQQMLSNSHTYGRGCDFRFVAESLLIFVSDIGR